MNKTILLVDDDPDIIATLSTQLQSAHFNTISAYSQSEAMQITSKQDYDLAILDLMMEHMDSGFVLAHHLKKAFPKKPIILLTAVISETGMGFDASTQEERSWVKADAFLDKPVRFEQLLREIERLL